MKSVYNSEPDISKKSERIQRVKVKYLKRIISTYLKINSFHKKIRAKELVKNQILICFGDLKRK